MSEKIYEVDQFYTGDFAQIMNGVYSIVTESGFFISLPGAFTLAVQGKVLHLFD